MTLAFTEETMTSEDEGFQMPHIKGVTHTVTTRAACYIGAAHLLNRICATYISTEGFGNTCVPDSWEDFRERMGSGKFGPDGIPMSEDWPEFREQLIAEVFRGVKQMKSVGIEVIENENPEDIIPADWDDFRMWMVELNGPYVTAITESRYGKHAEYEFMDRFKRGLKMLINEVGGVAYVPSDVSEDSLSRIRDELGKLGVDITGQDFEEFNF